MHYFKINLLFSNVLIGQGVVKMNLSEESKLVRGPVEDVHGIAFGIEHVINGGGLGVRAHVESITKEEADKISASEQLVLP